MPKNAPLAGQVAVVTGAARGVGAELARALAARGATVALVGLEPKELERSAAECGGNPGGVGWWEADVTDLDAMRTVAEEVTARFGRVDIVVANAGIAIGGSFLDSDPAAFQRVIEVNLLGSTTTARAFLPALIASRGYLLQIASLAAMTPAPLMTAYCASKSGVEAFAHALRGEVANQGVRVGVGYLSWTDTDMVRGADEDEVMREMRASLPWPTNRTYPLAPAVQRIADGIARRSVHVYAQGWLRSYQLIRGQIPLVLGRVAPLQLRKLEPRLRETAAARRGLVGRGGAADEEARAAREVPSSG
ncbi:SDR family oxidoreductase [Streptacidiphilus sp. N1-3]|uniref:SDR family oxidoreductase n=1 Tax=Streptacidiphilus alkalitolerans TaxID=3342712 RepID=A0ABV6X6W3_9ACTN